MTCIHPSVLITAQHCSSTLYTVVYEISVLASPVLLLIQLCSPGTMMLELQDRVADLEEWTEGKGLIVLGDAATFCSGSDLNAVQAISNAQVSLNSFTAVLLPADSSGEVTPLVFQTRTAAFLCMEVGNENKTQ